MGKFDGLKNLVKNLKGPDTDIDEEPNYGNEYGPGYEEGYDPDNGPYTDIEDETELNQTAAPKYDTAPKGGTQAMNRKPNIPAVNDDPEFPGLNYVFKNPTKYERSVVNPIADDIIEGKTVIINLSETNKGEALNIMNFLTGVAYAVDAQTARVDNTYVFIPKEGKVSLPNTETAEPAADTVDDAE